MRPDTFGQNLLFEGSAEVVQEQHIRRHFRHSYNSFMTKHYTQGKVMEFEEDLQLEYIRELVGEVAQSVLNDNELQFLGLSHR